MRYEPNNKRYRHRRKRRPESPRFISVEVEIRSQPRDECRIFGSEVRHEVAMTGLIQNGNSNDAYVIRFTHQNEVVAARGLCIGQRVQVIRGRFTFRHGRNGAEFEIRESELRKRLEVWNVPEFAKERVAKRVDLQLSTSECGLVIQLQSWAQN